MRAHAKAGGQRRVRSPEELIILSVFYLAIAGCDSMEGGAANDLDRLPRIFATEEARIGDVNDPERGFSRIAGVDVDRDGNVYVGEASVPEIIETPVATDSEEGAVLVTKMGLADDTIYSRTLRYRPVPYSAADLDSIAASAARRGGGFGVPMGGSAPPVPDNWQAMAAAFRGVMDFPEFQVPIARSWLAQDESLWLARRQEGSPVTDWVILDRDGNPRGELELPAGANPQWSRGDVLWAIVPDEFDVQWLVHYTLSPA